MLNHTAKEIYNLPSLLPQDASFRLRTDWSHVHFMNNIFIFVSGEVCNWQACQDIHVHGNYKSNGISHCKKILSIFWWQHLIMECQIKTFSWQLVKNLIYTWQSMILKDLLYCYQMLQFSIWLWHIEVSIIKVNIVVHIVSKHHGCYPVTRLIK